MIAWSYHRSVTPAVPGVTRRNWMAGALAALAAGRLQAARSHIAKGRVAAITDELGINPADAVMAARQLGLQWVDLRNVPGTSREIASLAEAELRHYAAELAVNKLKVSVLYAGLKIDSGQSGIAQAIGAASILGAGGVRILTGPRAADPAKELPAVARRLGEFVPMAEMAKVRLSIANRATQNVGTSAEAKAILDLLPSKWIGLDWIPREAAMLGEAPWPDGYAQLPKGRIFHATVRADDLSNGPSFINWRLILEAMQRDGYPREIGFETGSADGAFQTIDEPMRDLLHMVGEL
jgi:sugar phosphate isomerase/epimerase